MAFGDKVQSAKNIVESGSSIGATFPGATTAGNLLVAYVLGATSSITFTGPGTFSDLTGAAGDAAGTQDGWFKIADGSETTITATPSATSDLALVIVEYEGPFAGSPLDVQTAGTTTGTSNVTTHSTGSTSTTTQADALAVAAQCIQLHSDNITSWTNSFLEDEEQDGTSSALRPSVAVAHKVLSATGTVETTVSHSNARSKSMLAVFKKGAVAVTGSIAVALADFISAASGSVGGGVGGTIAVTLDSFVCAASGTAADPTWPGGLPTAAVIAIYDARELAGSDTDPVSSWPDSGPNAEDPLAQATGSQQPLIDDSGFDSVRSVKFDGSNDRLDMALAGSYTEDFAIIMVGELLTYPTGTAAVFYSTGVIPNKNILGVDDVEDPPGWVAMSGSHGTQSEHHHGTANQTYLEDTPSRFIMTEFIENDNRLRVWENGTLIIDEAPASDSGDLNNLVGLKVGAREDNSRFVNGRVAYVLLVDMTETDLATLQDAEAEIAPQFSVPGFASENTGTIAVTLNGFAAAFSGTAAVPSSTGTISVTLASFTPAFSGSAAVPAFTGTMAVTLASFTADFDGESFIEPPAVAGSWASTLASFVPAFSGTYTPGPTTGTWSSALADFTGVWFGTAISNPTGTIAVTLDDCLAAFSGQASRTDYPAVDGYADAVVAGFPTVEPVVPVYPEAEDL